ncbi:hypothetical protein [Burkholderia gladioli]|uniref:hypothetical protein n=1 Tax=Burkholderia gladioli TaxID=28095 RepID=UPI0016411EBB|nr:hypothetical protein [Burkholderia gladioli]
MTNDDDSSAIQRRDATLTSDPIARIQELQQVQAPLTGTGHDEEPSLRGAADGNKADTGAHEQCANALVNAWLTERGTTMDGASYIAALQLAAHVARSITTTSANRAAAAARDTLEALGCT